MDLSRLTAMLPGMRCLAALLLFFLALGGADVRAVVPLNDVTAAEAALRVLVHKRNEVILGGWVACVALFDESGDLPAGLIAPLLAENPNLGPVEACREKDDRLYVANIREPVPYVGCGIWPLSPQTAAPPGTVKTSCHIHRGPLNGYGLGFDVTRGADGELVATPNGDRWVE